VGKLVIALRVVDYAVKGDSFSAGAARVWSDQQILFSQGGGPFHPYGLAPDGKRFAVSLYRDGTAERHDRLYLTFLFNFVDELKRRVPAGE
jgi:hypothetical protein